MIMKQAKSASLSLSLCSNKRGDVLAAGADPNEGLFWLDDLAICNMSERLRGEEGRSREAHCDFLETDWSITSSTASGIIAFCSRFGRNLPLYKMESL